MMTRREPRGQAYKGTVMFSFVFIILILIMTAFQHEETLTYCVCLFVLAALPHPYYNDNKTRMAPFEYEETPTIRECHGFTNPCGLVLWVPAGVGMGCEFVTLTQPVPVTRV